MMTTQSSSAIRRPLSGVLFVFAKREDAFHADIKDKFMAEQSDEAPPHSHYVSTLSAGLRMAGNVLFSGDTASN